MNISKQAAKIYQEAIVMDGQLGFEPAMPWDFEKKWQLVDRYALAGVTAVTLSIANDESETLETLAYLAKIRKHIFAHPEKYILATTKTDILQAKNTNKIAIRLMMQGTSPIGKNLDLLEIFQALGISSLVLAYNIRTPIGSGVIESNDDGLSLLGKKWVEKMNQLGMTIDGSHTGHTSTMEALQLTKAPMIFSHSGAYAINPHVRNLKDDQIIATAKTGGVIGINGIGLLLGDPKASVEKYVDHVDYIAKLVGTEYIGIGLDNLYFADQLGEFLAHQTITNPEAYVKQVGKAIDSRSIQPEDLMSIVEVMLQRNYSEADIKAFLGGNSLRLIK